jgi:hypothetical protein
VENQGLNIVEGLTPSKTEEKPTSNVSVRRAGYVGEPATPGVMTHRRKEKNEEKLWMFLRTWTKWNLIREPLGTSWSQGRSSGSGCRAGTVGGDKKEVETPRAGTLGKERTVIHH